MSMYTTKKDAAHEKAADKAAEKAAEGPPVQEFPKMLYHPDGRSMTVASEAEEEQATKDGFKDTPQPAPEEKAEPKAKKD